MKTKQIIFLIGMLALLILLGVSLAIYSINSEASLDFEKTSSTKSTTNQKGNADSSLDTRSSQNKKVLSNSGSIKNSKASEKVVDQTLRFVKTNDSNTEGENSELEIVFYDGDKNSLLANYRLEIKYDFYNETPTRDFYTTDKEGKVRVKTNKKGYMALIVLATDYPVFRESISIYSGLNTHSIQLYRGGVIEVRATNQENKIVRGLQMILPFDEYYFREKKIGSSILYDVQRELYIISNIPIGNHEIFFKAKGFLETPNFKINIDSKKIIQLEIALQTPRVISFEIDAMLKPKSIQIVKTNIIYGCGYPRFEWPPFASPMNFKPVDGTTVYLNPNNKYEYTVEEKELPFLSIYIDEFAPQTIEINSNQDNYKLSLTKTLEKQLKVVDENGNPVSGANVFSNGNNFSQNLITNKDGIAKLSIGDDMNQYYVSVSHPDFVSKNERDPFDIKDNSVKTITLIEGNEIKGEVKFNGKPIAGAKVVLFSEIDNINFNTQLFSDQNGAYSFCHLEYKKNTEYCIKASHPNWGTVRTEKFSLDDKVKEINLDLKEELSLTIRLVDKNGLPMPNQKIILNCLIGDYESQKKTTNENGMCQFLNLFNGNYYSLNLTDNRWKIENNTINIPAGEVVIKALENDFIPLTILKPDGGLFNGLVFIVSGWSSISNYFPIYPIPNEYGRYNLAAFNLKKEGQNKSLKLEVPGYAMVELETYDKPEDMPKDLKVQLKTGENLKVKVVDALDDKPISTSIVEVSYSYSRDRAFPTNRKGEVVFTNLNGKSTILVKADKYALYQSEIDVSETKELLVKLTKSGQLNGHLPIVNKSINATWLDLVPNFKAKNQVVENRIQLNGNGNFIFNRLLPGEYSLSAVTNFNGEKPQIDLLSNKIIIEGGKTTEVNFEPNKKNK